MAWFPPVVTAQPETEPVSLDEAKRQVHEDASDNDELLRDAIVFARGRVESITGTRLVEQTVTLRADSWNDLSSLNVAPVKSITSISYVDPAGDDQTLPTEAYEAHPWGLSPSVNVRQCPSPKPGSLITVIVVAGYDVVPPEVRFAILLLVGEYYRSREAVSDETEATVLSLLHNHRRYS